MAAWLADAVTWVHLGWVGFLVLGAIPGWRWPWVRWLHLAGLAFAAWIVLGGRLCPPTLLEHSLRNPGGPARPAETFLGRLADQVVYAPLPRSWVLAGYLAVVGVTLVVYACAWRKRGAA